MVTLTRSGVKIFYDCSKNWEKKVLKESLSFKHPDAHFSTNEYWDGWVKYFDERGSFFYHGMLHYVLVLFDKRGVDYELKGFEEDSTSWIEFSAPFLLDERDYQRNSIKAGIAKRGGIIKVPTRGGKTYIAAEIIRLLMNHDSNHHFLFVTDTTDAFNQNIDDICSVTGLAPEDIGRIQGEKFELKKVNVAMIQTLQSVRKLSMKRMRDLDEKKQDRVRKYKKLFKVTTVTIFDEVQEYGSSKVRLSIIRKLGVAGDYLFGISGTPYKSDEFANKNIEGIFGGISYEIEESELIDRKVLSENKVLLMMYNHPQYAHEFLSFSELEEEAIIGNVARNKIIANIVSICLSLRIKVMVIFSSRLHGYLMEEICGVKFLCGDHSSEERMSHKESFLKKSGGALFVSDIWKKAITLPEVEVLVNADGGKEQSLITQRRGRTLGVTEDKTRSLTVDFIDFCDKYFNDHTLSRIAAYESKLEKSNIDVLDSHDITFKYDLEEYLINWFELDIAND